MTGRGHRLSRARLLARLWMTRPAPMPRLPLALVVPVWNDAAGLARLLDQVAALRLFAEVVVVDDGSDPALPPPRVAGAQVRLIRHATPQGGGVARNAGLAAVTQPYLIYLDADDLPAPELPALIADLACDVAANGAFDLCLFKHADSRVAPEARWGQPQWDEALWARAGHAMGALAPARPGALPILAQTANYPWNKVYRTAFLRENGIGCATTAVHQDIALHWGALVAAGRVLVSDRICVWHGVDVAPVGGPASGAASGPASGAASGATSGAASGAASDAASRPASGAASGPAALPRLTARSGIERLQVFAALDPVVAPVAAAGPDWQAALAGFTLDLIDWAAGRIAPALLADLRAAEATWLADRFGPWLPALAADDPALATRLRYRIAAIGLRVDRGPDPGESAGFGPGAGAAAG